MVYRITYGLVDIPASSFFHPTSINTRGHSLCFLVPCRCTDTYSNSFFPSGIHLWNQLPEDFVTAPPWYPLRKVYRGRLPTYCTACSYPFYHLLNLYILHLMRILKFFTVGQCSRVGPALYWKKKKMVIGQSRGGVAVSKERFRIL